MGAAIDESALTGAMADTLRMYLPAHPGFEGSDASIDVPTELTEAGLLEVEVNGIRVHYRLVDPHTVAATIAAHAATEGAAEMLRFARDGAASIRLPFEWDPVEKLVEAAKLAAQIERDFAERIVGEGRDVEGLEKLRNFIAGCTLFLEGWA